MIPEKCKNPNPFERLRRNVRNFIPVLKPLLVFHTKHKKAKTKKLVNIKIVILKVPLGLITI